MRPTINSSDDLGKAQGSTQFSSVRAGKNIWKKTIDLALYLVACLTAGTGLLLAYRLPHGAGDASRVVFLAMGGMSGAIFTPGSPIPLFFLRWPILR